MTLASQYETRDAIADFLAADLLGPEEIDEVISDAPITKYLTGILFPVTTESDPEQDIDDDEADEAGEDGLADPPVAMATVRNPSSMGLTFGVDTRATTTVRVVAEAAKYVPLATDPKDPIVARSRGRRKKQDDGLVTLWARKPLAIEPIDVLLEPGDHTTFLGDGLQLFTRVRHSDENGHASVTIALVNRNVSVPGNERDALAFFQPRLAVETVGANAIVERVAAGAAQSDGDLRSYSLLYRHARNFAVGHGCAVNWADGEEERIGRLETTFVPTFELLLAESNPKIAPLSMKALSEGSTADVLEALAVLASGYEEWISERTNEAAELNDTFRAIALENLAVCQRALVRLRDGIEFLKTDDIALRSFRLANEAMLIQRAQAEWVKSGKPAVGPECDDRHQWRPFQIAFIVMCLRGIADDKHQDRDLADLLWFPTGGGKTEAYLGLIAFTISNRRLRGRGGGVNVLMRYTLRLLTIQQFERAALLICALETLRDKYADLGTEKISIGLWVGQGATPNDHRGTRKALDKARTGVTLTEGNPIQIHSCPWCGTPLDHKNYWLASNPERLVVNCGTDECYFGKGLPVYLVDTDIYEQRPTLIIATADKFASLPWRDATAALFNRTAPLLAPPELIIQDELHLISGPLGTLAGLYEAVIDITCERSGRRPKVIASTATIRRAKDQSLALFDREVMQFPPPGIDARDSYFSVEAAREDKGTRRYVGLMAPGSSQTTLLVRTYAALMQGAASVRGDDASRDPYWTLVGYFNSLRVLGGAKLQLQDDVRDRLGLIASASGGTPRKVEPNIELTSRESSAEIPSHLQRMAISLPDVENTLAAVLATNMISVGVDVDRLGLMAVMGQPQSTSEYIQATSRVGRSRPGLVVTMFNAARSRDRSHYESFLGYHSALYRQVESTSVTPFSPRARDRGLHAVVVSLARLLISTASRNDDASKIAQFEPELRRLCDDLTARVERVSPNDLNATSKEIDEIIDTWLARATQTHDLSYRNNDHPDRALLVDAARDDVEESEALPTLWSLRDVDRSSNLYEVR